MQLDLHREGWIAGNHLGNHPLYNIGKELAQWEERLQ